MSKKTKKGNNEKSMKLSLGKPEKITTGLDPNLQRAILESREGKSLDGAVSQSTEDGTVVLDVIAKLKDPQQEVPGLNVIRTIGQIVTGTVEVEKIEDVRTNDNTVSLKLARKLHQQLEFSVSEIQADQTHLAARLPSDIGSIDGRGVIVGVVDYGCDFNHRNFRNADGSTRLLSIWDQRGGRSTMSPQGFGYGREFDVERINTALQSSQPYQQLRYNPGDRSHGTHVMDIAAGNGQATGNPGVTPAADLIFVHSSAEDVSGEETFGNSARLLDAVDYVFTKAAALGRPAVVNISLGTHGGPHDGSTLVEQGFDTLLEQPDRAIVISAGNAWQRGSHASGSVTADAARTLTWQIGTPDFTHNELEVWYDGSAELAVTLITPDGQRLGPVAVATTVNLLSQGAPVGKIIHRQDDPNNHDNHINVFLDRSLPAGDWGIELSTADAGAVPFHAWIERDDNRSGQPNNQSRFSSADDDQRYTLGSISCGQKTIAVGSYRSGSFDSELSSFTAEGPTRDGKQKPEVSAPGQFLQGQGILAARSSSQGVTRKSGTSMAAPHVAGLVALLMQAADHPLSIDEIRSAIMDNARSNPPTAGHGWDSRFGVGRIDGLATIQTTVSQAPVLAPVPSEMSTAFSVPHSNGVDQLSLEEMILAAARATAQSGARVRIQLEIEPA